MLKKLSIKNLAIIENIDVSFADGFTVLTGETGAGKSLVIDSLSLLLGARATNELIRAGEDSAVLEGAFFVKSPALSGLLLSFNIPENDGELIITRVLSKTKSAIKVNGVSITLQDLQKLSRHLADIHVQFDFEKILNPENYLSIIDGFSAELSGAYKKEYANFLGIYREKKAIYEDLVHKKEKIDQDRDFFEYQYKELKAASLKEGEEEEIDAEISLLHNYDKIYELSQEADSIIREDFLDRLYELNKVLSKLSALQGQYKEIHDQLDDRYYELDDAFKTLKGKLENLDYDPSRLNDLEQRSSDLSSLKRKYKKTIPELIAYKEELESTLGSDSSFEEQLEKAKEDMQIAFKDAYSKGEELTAVRKKIASSIEKELEKNMEELLLKAKFEVWFKDHPGDEAALREDGLDDVDFLIETNRGEGKKSLSKVISGGEASRIMLSFKAVLIKANKIPTVIFDEIDTGISGETAEAVARKIHDISMLGQVIAITHMPQVASKSNHHILISKEEKSGRTFAHIKELSLKEKIEQIAYLISGGEVTKKQLEYAEEMVLGHHD